MTDKEKKLLHITHGLGLWNIMVMRRAINKCDNGGEIE